jgi:hypothetical protein
MNRRLLVRLTVVVAVVGITAIARAESGTPVTLSTALTPVDDPSCNYTPSSPCQWIGTFEANDDTTANLICPSGTISETYWFPHGRGPFTIAERTLTCPDGSTLVMRVSRYAFIPLTETTGEILETWVITGGTGRMASLQGRGPMDEFFDVGGPIVTFGGTVTGFVH